MRGHRAPAASDRHVPAAGGDPATRYPESDGALALAYEVSGDPGKPVLLLVHGGTASRRSWDLVTPALRTRHRIVAVDMRGHGQSPAPESGYSAVQLSADLHRVVDELALERVTVVGHSLGGMAAVLLAAHRPDVVKKLVLLNVPVTPGASGAIASLEARVNSPGFFPVSQAFVAEWTLHSRPVPTSYLATQQAHVVALRPVVWRQMFGELAKADIRPVLKGIRQPTLILWGARDKLLDAAQYEALQAGIGHARLILIDDAGHSPSSATPDRIAAEIASFAA
jgi:pimeloyl-ACP methyl ester carboxylesterase